MSQHTPGPWTVTPNARPEIEGMEYMVRQCDGDGHDTYTVAIVDELPNARLIAAAPELLAALERLTSECACVVETGGPDSRNLCGYCEQPIYYEDGAEDGHGLDCPIEPARAAIHAATGPALPQWAKNASVVFDDELSLAFVKRGTEWRPYIVAPSGKLVPLSTGSKSKLERCRELAVAAIGSSIDAMVKACHPGSGYVHMRKSYNSHLCGAPYQAFQTADNLTKTDCPMCIAVASEDLLARIKDVGVEAIDAARQRVRDTREMNALGKTVTGETATEEL